MSTKRRTPEMYRNCKAEAIASGSVAQVIFFIEDAKADIEMLLSVNAGLLDAVKAALPANPEKHGGVF